MLDLTNVKISASSIDPLWLVSTRVIKQSKRAFLCSVRHIIYDCKSSGISDAATTATSRRRRVNIPNPPGSISKYTLFADSWIRNHENLISNAIYHYNQ